MKKAKFFFRAAVALSLVAVLCTSCVSEKAPVEITSESTDATSSAEREKCTVHHGDYHSIPTELALYVGESTTDEWIKARDPESVDDGDGCPCSERNIKAFIDDFEIPREVFAVKADLAHCATYDCEMLYEKSAEEIDEYFRDAGALSRLNIKSQHFALLEHIISDDHTEEIMSLIVTDSTGAHGSVPSIPQMAQLLDISREKLEEYIKTVDERTEEICGELLKFDYDLDMIYNADGTYKKLPETDELSSYDRLLHLNRVFCRIGD